MLSDHVGLQPRGMAQPVHELVVVVHHLWLHRRVGAHAPAILRFTGIAFELIELCLCGLAGAAGILERPPRVIPLAQGHLYGNRQGIGFRHGARAPAFSSAHRAWRRGSLASALPRAFPAAKKQPSQAAAEWPRPAKGPIRSCRPPPAPDPGSSGSANTRRGTAAPAQNVPAKPRCASPARPTARYRWPESAPSRPAHATTRCVRPEWPVRDRESDPAGHRPRTAPYKTR